MKGHERRQPTPGALEGHGASAIAGITGIAGIERGRVARQRCSYECAPLMAPCMCTPPPATARCSTLADANLPARRSRRSASATSGTDFEEHVARGEALAIVGAHLPAARRRQRTELQRESAVGLQSHHPAASNRVRQRRIDGAAAVQVRRNASAARGRARGDRRTGRRGGRRAGRRRLLEGLA